MHLRLHEQFFSLHAKEVWPDSNNGTWVTHTRAIGAGLAVGAGKWLSMAHWLAMAQLAAGLQGQLHSLSQLHHARRPTAKKTQYGFCTQGVRICLISAPLAARFGVKGMGLFLTDQHCVCTWACAHVPAIWNKAPCQLVRRHVRPISRQSTC